MVAAIATIITIIIMVIIVQPMVVMSSLIQTSSLSSRIGWHHSFNMSDDALLLLLSSSGSSSSLQSSTAASDGGAASLSSLWSSSERLVRRAMNDIQSMDHLAGVASSSTTATDDAITSIIGATGNAASSIIAAGAGAGGGGGGVTGAALSSTASSSPLSSLRCVNFEVLQQDVYSPANVQLLLDIKQCDTDMPLVGLSSALFVAMGGPSDSSLSIFDAGEAMQSVVAQSGDYSLQVTVAIDLSGSMSGLSLTNLKSSLRSFVNTLSGPKVFIALFGFGGGGLEELQWYTVDTDALLWTIENIGNMLPLDTASNVYGAVVDATTENYYAVSEATTYYAQGIVVIYTDGRDNAGVYLKDDAVTAALQSTSYVYSVAFGNNVDVDFLNDIGIDGFVYASNSVLLSRALIDIVTAMATEASNDYVYELCSPARSGSQIVEVGLIMQTSGIRARATYDATGFTYGCGDSNDDTVDPCGSSDDGTTTCGFRNGENCGACSLTVGRQQFDDITYGDTVDFRLASNGDPFVVDVSTIPFDTAAAATHIPNVIATYNYDDDDAPSMTPLMRRILQSPSIKSSSILSSSLSLWSTQGSNNVANNVRVYMKTQGQANNRNYQSVYPSNETSSSLLSIPFAEPVFGQDYFFSVNLVRDNGGNSGGSSSHVHSRIFYRVIYPDAATLGNNWIMYNVSGATSISSCETSLLKCHRPSLSSSLPLLSSRTTWLVSVTSPINAAFDIVKTDSSSLPTLAISADRYGIDGGIVWFACGALLPSSPSSSSSSSSASGANSIASRVAYFMPVDFGNGAYQCDGRTANGGTHTHSISRHVIYCTAVSSVIITFYLAALSYLSYIVC